MKTSNKAQHTHSKNIILYLLWDCENVSDLLQRSQAAMDRDKEAFMKEWENRNEASSPFHDHIVTDCILAWEELFNEKAEDFVSQVADDSF